MEEGKIYYHINMYVLCAVCRYVCHFDTEREQELINLKDPAKRIFYCTNQDCSQFGVRGEISPLEANIVK